MSAVLWNRRSGAISGRQPILRLPSPPTRAQAVELVEKHQLAVSAEGDHAAVIVRAFAGTGYQLVHSGLVTPSAALASDARILKVTPHRAIAWGAFQDAWAGTFVLTESGTTRRHELHTVRSLHSAGPFGLMPRGMNEFDPPNVDRLVLHDTHFLVEKDTDWTVLHDGSLLLVGPLGGPRFRYRIQREDREGVEYTQFVDFSPPLPFEAVTARALKFGTRYAYVVERRGGRTVLWIEGLELQIDGVVECVWNSPTAQSAVLLVRNRRNARESGAERRLIRIQWPLRESQRDRFFEVVHAGRFEMDHADLWWGRGGRDFAAQVTSFASVGQIDHEQNMLIATNADPLPVPAEACVTEVAFDPIGNLAGYILRTQDAHVPVVGDELQEPLRYAWNLRPTWEGVQYNSIEGEAVYRTSLDLNRPCA